MDARELMIGDWARIRYNHFETGEEIVKDFRVGQLAKLGLGDDEPLYAWSEKSNMAKVSKVEQIPITPEILEKNGFSKLEHGWILKRIGMEICVEFIAEKWSLVIHNELALKDEHGRADLVTFCHDWFKGFYVHELQHALRLCGIEKEIEI